MVKWKMIDLLQVEGQTDRLSYARKHLKTSWSIPRTLRLTIVGYADSIDDKEIFHCDNNL